MTREQAKAFLQSVSGIAPEQLSELLNDSELASKVAEKWKNTVLNSIDFPDSPKAWKVYTALIALANIDSIAIPEWRELAETDLPSEWLLPAESNFITEA